MRADADARARVLAQPSRPQTQRSKLKGEADPRNAVGARYHQGPRASCGSRCRVLPLRFPSLVDLWVWLSRGCARTRARACMSAHVRSRPRRARARRLEARAGRCWRGIRLCMADPSAKVRARVRTTTRASARLTIRQPFSAGSRARSPATCRRARATRPRSRPAGARDRARSPRSRRPRRAPARPR
jgi:hypothetical protein